MTVKIGILGKHPGFGDFISAGFDPDIVTGLQKWADTVLHRLRTDMGDAWSGFWDRAQMLRFWAGPALSGRTLAGVFLPSHDKVGRRYPLILAVQGAGIQAPVIDPDQAIYDALEAHLAGVTPGAGGASLLEGLNLGEDLPDETAGDIPPEGPLLWAHHPGGDLAALLAEAGPPDARRALTTRSYWWSPARAEGAAALWLGQAGLPDAPSMGWLLAGQPGVGRTDAPEESGSTDV